MFIYDPQRKLPPEEGVPTTEEVDEANFAFHRSLLPLMTDIVAKLAPGAAVGPVDFAATVKDDVVLLAVAAGPDGDDVTIDWNRLAELDFSLMKFSNPYREEERDFNFDVVVTEAESRGDFTFSNVDCTIGKDTVFHLVLGQGKGLICGAAILPDDDEKEMNPKEMRTIMLAALKSAIEDSEQIAKEEPLASVPTHMAIYFGDGTGMMLRSRYEKRDGKYVSDVYLGVIGGDSPQTTLAMLGQFFGGFLLPNLAL